VAKSLVLAVYSLFTFCGGLRVKPAIVQFRRKVCSRRGGLSKPTSNPFPGSGQSIDMWKRQVFGPLIQVGSNSKEQVMSKQPWSPDTIARGLAAVLIAGIMLVAAKAGAHPISDSLARGIGHQVATFAIADEERRTDELDPAHDGSIIIECVALTDHTPRAVDEPGPSLWVRTVAVPQFPLGPSTCSPKEHKRA
jgi:hypothetical protein